MKHSEQINELAAALAKAQAQMQGAKKDSDNPFFKSKYADLASVVDAVRGPFGEHGLSYVQLPQVTESERVIVETVLLHSSGQWISSETEVPVTKTDAQGFGSALTYARRYGLQAMAGIAAEDDDGNAAAKARPPAASELRIQRAETHPEDKLFPVPPTGPDRPALLDIDEASKQMKAAVDAELAGLAGGQNEKLTAAILLRKQELKLSPKDFQDYKRKHGGGRTDLYGFTTQQLESLLGELQWMRRLQGDKP